MKRSHFLLCVAFLLLVAAFGPIASQIGTGSTLWLRYGLALLVILRWLPVAHRSGRRSSIIPWALAYCLLATVSILWSDVPATSLTGCLDLLVITAASIAIGVGISADQVVRLLAGVGLAILAASTVVMLLFPATQIDEYGLNTWTGIFSNTNELGRQMVITAVLCLTLALRYRGYLVAAAAAGVVGVMTGSAQVVVVGVAAVAALFATRALSRTRRARGALAFLFAGATALALYLALAGAETIISGLGKDSSLSNRVPIWQSILGTLNAHWLTGYGYGAYWHDTGVLSEMATASRQPAQQAHNSALELIAQVGILGVFIVAVLLIISVSASYSAITRSPVAASALMTLTFVLITYSMTASVFGRSPVQIYWVALVALATSLTMDGSHKDSALPARRAPGKGRNGAIPRPT